LIFELPKEMMKKYFLLISKAAISFGIIFFTVHSLDADQLKNQVLKTDWPWLGVSCFLLTVSYFLGAFQWGLILQMVPFNLSYRKTLGYYYVGLFFNNFLLSGMGGDLLRVYDIQKHSATQERLSPALATVIFDRFIGLLTLIFFACLSGMFVIGRGESFKMFLGIVLLLSVWIFFLVALLNKNIADKTVRPLFRLVPEKIYERLQHLYHTMNNFRTKPQHLIKIIITSMAVQSLRILAIWAVGRAMGDRSPLVYYLIFVPIISLAASLPISIGGTGPREQTAMLLFNKIGVAAEVSFSIGFLTYIVSSLSTIPGALVFLLRKSHANE
jgi:uncharacterized protein (TIRG00374 family)